jgi:ubiquinone/menaquinone biosynthesis C-methylase UbiE
MTGEAGYWDRQADTFDHQPDHGLLDAQVRQAWQRLLLAELPPAPAAIADLGCGTGTLSVLLAAEGYAVTGLDFAPQMIRAARAKARAAGVSARFELANAAAPTLPAASFDVVLARHVLWAMPDVGAALAAWVRLLLPGGVLLLIEGRWAAADGGLGVGLTAREAGRAVLRHRADATITVLDDPTLWGAPITDERYLLISRR